MSDEITQQEVDKFISLSADEWKKMKSEFKGSDILFTTSHDAIEFLAFYEQTKEILIEKGFDIPKIQENIDIKFCD